ncbi:MAG: carotenoid 1,2-hydratase [Anaerolineae bacterium]|nr:carotenoid 1,2-hydratase [Anaerolineae bacterium]
MMSKKWQILLIGLSILVVALFGLSLVDISPGDEVRASAALDASGMDTSGYARAIEPYDWHFPQDFGAHPDFQTEWWYYTGNLATDDGRRFGFQFTIFRRAITPPAEERDSGSEWRTNQVYLAHFTVSDISSGQFYHDERFSRSSADLAGATVDPRYRVWVEDWEILAQNDDASQVTIRAAADDFSVDLTLEQTKPPALQGDNGLSPKSEETGNASYYYSLTRLITEGTITVEGESFVVDGLTWKDHEFSTSALGSGAQGWDWFGLIFDDDTEMMIGQIRLQDGGREPAFGGLYVYPDGSTEYLASEQINITPTDTWTSPHTGAEYPSGWDVTVETSQGAIRFSVTPLMRDQELADTDPSYWEGAVRIEGDVNGYGYAELTGYTTSMENRF